MKYIYKYMQKSSFLKKKIIVYNTKGQLRYSKKFFFYVERDKQYFIFIKDLGL